MEDELFWQVIDFVMGVLDIGIYYWFMSKTSGEQKNRWLAKVGCVLQYAVLRISFLSGIPVTIKMLIAASIGFACFYFSYRVSFIRLLLMHITWLTAMMGSEIIVYGILIITQRTDSMEILMSTSAVLFEGTIMSKAFLIVILFMLLRFFAQQKRRYSVRETVLVILQLLSNIITINVLISLASLGVEKTGISPYWLTSIGIVSLFALIVCLMMTTGYFNSQQREQQFMLMQAEAERMYSVYQEKQESARKLHHMYHDIRNHMHALEGIAKNNPEIQQYVDQIDSQIEPVTYITDTGNPIADTVIFDKVTILKKLDAKVNISIEDNSLRNVESMDACVILSNALDNIIEAIKDIDNAEVSLNIVNEENETILYFANTCDENKINKASDGKFKTIKKNKKDHGWGLDSIDSIINKLGGILSTKYKDNLFELTVIMPNRLS